MVNQSTHQNDSNGTGDIGVLSEKKLKTRGYFLVVFTALCFGLNGLGIRYFFAHIGGASLPNVAFWGLLGASVAGLIFNLPSALFRKRMVESVKRDGRVILVVSLLSATGALMWFRGLEITGAGNVALLAKSQIIYATILGLVILKERMSAFEGLGFATAIGGLFLLTSLPEDLPLEAAIYILISAFIYSVQSLIVKLYAPGLTGREFALLRAFMMVVFYGTLFSITGDIELIPVKSILFLGGVSISGLLIGRMLYFEAHKYLGIRQLNTGMLLEPVFVLILGGIFLGEPFSTPRILGAILILTGLWMMTRKNLHTDRYIPGFLIRILYSGKSDRTNSR